MQQGARVARSPRASGSGADPEERGRRAGGRGRSGPVPPERTSDGCARPPAARRRCDAPDAPRQRCRRRSRPPRLRDAPGPARRDGGMTRRRRRGGRAAVPPAAAVVPAGGAARRVRRAGAGGGGLTARASSVPGRNPARRCAGTVTSGPAGAPRMARTRRAPICRTAKVPKRVRVTVRPSPSASVSAARTASSARRPAAGGAPSWRPRGRRRRAGPGRSACPPPPRGSFGSPRAREPSTGRRPVSRARGRGGRTAWLGAAGWACLRTGTRYRTGTQISVRASSGPSARYRRPTCDPRYRGP